MQERNEDERTSKSSVGTGEREADESIFLFCNASLTRLFPPSSSYFRFWSLLTLSFIHSLMLSTALALLPFCSKFVTGNNAAKGLSSSSSHSPGRSSSAGAGTQSANPYSLHTYTGDAVMCRSFLLLQRDRVRS